MQEQHGRICHSSPLVKLASIRMRNLRGLDPESSNFLEGESWVVLHTEYEDDVPSWMPPVRLIISSSESYGISIGIILCSKPWGRGYGYAI
jgi:hypothetical protein